MRVRVLAAGLAGALMVAGCGGGGKPVEGNVVLGGKAYDPAANGELTVSLGKEGGGGTASGPVQPDGTFKLRATDGGGIPAGKYKVSITRYPATADAGKGKAPAAPVSKDTGEVWDIGTAGPFTLDLTKLK